MSGDNPNSFFMSQCQQITSQNTKNRIQKTGYKKQDTKKDEGTY